MLIFTAALAIFLSLELIYFKIANHFNIIDKPNQRSSHTRITLRGGGIIFPIAFILGIIIWQPSLWIIGLAVLLISTISFLDDVLTLNNKLRITIHILSVALLIYQIYLSQVNIISLLHTPYSLLFLLPFALILIIGIINAYNFMDGINGITVLYSIITILSLWLIQVEFNINLIDTSIWQSLTASLLVFAYFNLRKTAKTFAGDIGSISVALIICYLMLQLMLNTQELKWLLLLGIYGLDSVATIFCRLLRKENIFDAHRSHFYQYLANEKKWPHVAIAILYAISQVIINLSLLYSETLWIIYGCYLIIVFVYIAFRLFLEGKERLFKNYHAM